ncbi:MAG TPA: D-2-hydroxyacid dehydrogenase [Chloroflexi bacterium]|nr:D-2-hydroxyacid dehydrogenase [Chloroflexota bacterium]
MSDIILLSTMDLTDGQLARVAKVSDQVRVKQVYCRHSHEVGPLLEGVEILLTQHGRISLERADRLRWVQLMNAGVDHLLDQPIMTSGAMVTTASGIHATPIAEYVLGMMLALTRQLPLAQGLQRRRAWPEDTHKTFAGYEMYGETVGILGYGSIGREVGRMARSLGMRVLALSSSGRRRDTGYVVEGTGDPEGVIPDAWYRADQLHEFLSLCRYLVVAVPLTPQTHHMLDAAALAAMPPGAFLINIARGAVIDEAALIEALRTRRLAGAALDVFEREPLPADSPLWDMEGVIITPHISGFTARYNDRLSALLAENLRRYLAGEPLYNRVDIKRGY